MAGDFSLTAIILAGGQSSRMGQDKALLPVQGVPLLQRTCDLALQCAESVYVVTSRPEAYHSLHLNNCRLVEEVPLDSSRGSHGPLVGFAQGLSYVETEWVLLLACDLPYLQREILQRWFSQAKTAESAIAVLPLTDKGWEPLCGFYRTRCLLSLQTFIQQGGRSFQSWLNQEFVQAIVFSENPQQRQQEQKMLFNCNTPEDFLILHRKT